MVKTMSFQWYVGQGLASRLPYRRRGLLSGAQVCEWAAVRRMVESGFIVGCAVSLVDSVAAETALGGLATPGGWKTVYPNTVQRIQETVERKDILDVRFQDLVSDATRRRPKRALLTPRQCSRAIGHHTRIGLVFGLLCPDRASSMLREWVSKKQGWQDLGVGGLHVDVSTPLANVEEACQHAWAIYQTWRTEVEQRSSLLDEQHNPPVKNRVEARWLDSFIAVYGEAVPLVDTIVNLTVEAEPAALHGLLGASWSLERILESSKAMPRPSEKELRGIKKDFEKTLSVCIKASEMVMKAFDDMNHGAMVASRMHFASVVGWAGHARVYYQALTTRLNKIGY